MSHISVLRRKFLQNFSKFSHFHALFASLTPRGPSGLSHTCTSGHGSRERTYTIGTILQPTAARHEHVALPFDLLKPCRMRRVCHPRAQTRLIRLRGVEGIGVWGRGRRREISEIWVANSRKFLKISCAAATCRPCCSQPLVQPTSATACKQRAHVSAFMRHWVFEADGAHDYVQETDDDDLRWKLYDTRVRWHPCGPVDRR